MMTQCSKNQGFTLIELMITVGIIGILAAVAFPSYTLYVAKANRADAQDRLTEVMFEQERFQLRRRTYTTDLRDLGYQSGDDEIESKEGFYTVAAAVCGGGIPIADCVLLTATPVEDSYQDVAGEDPLTLNSRGERGGKWRR